MHPNQYRFLELPGNTFHQGNMLTVVQFIAKSDRLELSELTRHDSLSMATNKPLVLKPVADEICNADQP